METSCKSLFISWNSFLSSIFTPRNVAIVSAAIIRKTFIASNSPSGMVIQLIKCGNRDLILPVVNQGIIWYLIARHRSPWQRKFIFYESFKFYMILRKSLEFTVEIKTCLMVEIAGNEWWSPSSATVKLFLLESYFVFRSFLVRHFIYGNPLSPKILDKC